MSDHPLRLLLWLLFGRIDCELRGWNCGDHLDCSSVIRLGKQGCYVVGTRRGLAAHFDQRRNDVAPGVIRLNEKVYKARV
jgi:hypothetical protein